ncbi:MAG TPA: aromatic amino acid transport family protein [Candidatus Paceibacterota bacterium]
MYKKLVLPASLLAGVIIGAGMFSLPFLFRSVGILTGLFYLLFFSAVFIIVYFVYGDIILRTAGQHRLVGYARLYLGRGGFWFALWMGLIQLFFVLTVYLILAPSFSELFLPHSRILQVLLFWVVGSFVILYEGRKIALLEFLITFGMVAIIGLVFWFGVPSFLELYPDWGNIDVTRILIAGPILFALSGTLAIPEVISYFREARVSKRFIASALIVGGVLPAIVYAIFVAGVLGLSAIVSEDAITGLIGQVPGWFLILFGVLGVFTLISSYIVVGLNVRRVLEFDLGWSAAVSQWSVVFGPLLIYFLITKDFLDLISFIGSILLPIESLLVFVMWYRMNKKSPEPPILAHKLVQWCIPVAALVFGVVLVLGLI